MKKCDALHLPSYVREEAGTHRYNAGTDRPKLCATSCGGQSLVDKKSENRPSVISAGAGRLSDMLMQALVQCRTRPYAQSTGTYSDKSRSVTAAGSDLSRFEEEIDASSWPTARRRETRDSAVPQISRPSVDLSDWEPTVAGHFLPKHGAQPASAIEGLFIRDDTGQADEIICPVHDRAVSHANCSPMRRFAIGTSTSYPSLSISATANPSRASVRMFSEMTAQLLWLFC